MLSTRWKLTSCRMVVMVVVIEKEGMMTGTVLPANAGDIRDMVQSLGWEDPLEEAMTTHSSILAWRIPWTEELVR